MTAEAVLLLVTGFTLKHLVCDYMAQTAWMVAHKGRYGHPGGVAHVAVHGVGSVVVLGLAGVAPALLAGLVLAEMVVHYHIDWTKERISRATGWTPRARGFWVAFGVDQTLHMMTYLAMVAVLL